MKSLVAVASVMRVFDRSVAYCESPVVAVYVKSASTADPDCHHQMGSAKRARPCSGYVARIEDANAPAVVRRSLAAGAAAAVADGVAEGATEDVAAKLAEAVGVADSTAMFVEFVNRGESGKKTDTKEMILDGSMLTV